jgi:hypothetical protein
MSDWHASPDVLTRYAEEPEALDDAVASSLELHLLGCEPCRAALADATPPATLARSWDTVADRIDRPRPGAAERVLRHLGVASTHARLVAATRSLQLSWLGAMAAVVAGTVLVAHRTDSPGPFLVVAPIVPLVSVAIAFAAGSDPAGEAGAAAPLSGLGLVLRRAIAVLVATLLVLTVGGASLPGFTLADLAWVLPALALSLGGLALGTWMRVEIAASTLALSWLAALWTAVALDPSHPLPDLAPLAIPGQLTCAALVAIATAVLVARRDTFANLGRTA